MVAEPEVVVDVRQAQHRPNSALEVLIKWKQLPLFEATWGDAPSIPARFSAFHLEDKMRIWARGNVMNSTKPHQLITHTRKKGKNGSTEERGKAGISQKDKGQNGKDREGDKRIEKEN